MYRKSTRSTMYFHPADLLHILPLVRQACAHLFILQMDWGLGRQFPRWLSWALHFLLRDSVTVQEVAKITEVA